MASVLGPSSAVGASDSLESVDNSSTNPADPPTSQPSGSEFAKFKDHFLSRFTRLEKLLLR